MKRKWKYGRGIAQLSVMKGVPVFVGVATVFIIFSCSNRDEHKHFPTSKTSDLDGLVQPSNQIVFSDVKTISPMQQSHALVLNATGVISYDPRLLNNISARFGGRIEKLYVRFNFENVLKGQRIMDIYSPEIVTAQQDLIYLLNNSSTDLPIINASEKKLKLMGLTDEQLRQIKLTKQAINPLPIYSPYSGHIHDIGISSGMLISSSMNSGMSSGMNSTTASSQSAIENMASSKTSGLSLKEGMYVQSGQPVFSVYSISQVWAILNIFPQDAPLVKKGDSVSITAETNPNNAISSTISFIEPVAGQNASAIQARVYLQNAENLHLKIGTLLTAKITSKEVNGLWLPRKAVVNLGQKQVVFLKNENHFTAKTIHTGIATDSIVQIISGLTGNESVALNAQFMVDSESFIQTDGNEQK